MRKPFIYSDPIPGLSAGDYDTFVASWEEDTCPQYAVINRATGVVEFTSENKGFVSDWLQHFVLSKEREPEPDFAKLVAVEAAKKAN